MNSDLKFVPIRLDDCNPPAILKDLLCIDLYAIGIDEAISQMKAVVNRGNNYKPLEDKDNLICYMHVISEYEIEFEIRATMFSVQSADFAFVCNNSFDDFEVVPVSEQLVYTRGLEIFKDYPNG